MFLSILFAAVGVAGALYSFIVALLGLINGPYCKQLLIFWGTPFKDRWDTPQHLRACNDNPFCLDMFKCVLSVSLRDESYLKDRSTWTTCTEPKNVVEFNVGLFSTLLVTSAVQLILCAMQMINGLFGCLCGTCKEKGVRDSWETKEWRMRNAKGVVAQSSSNTSVWKKKKRI